MSSAYKCDRCGEFYDSERTTFEYAGKKYIGVFLAKDRNNADRIDLCPKCVEGIGRYILNECDVEPIHPESLSDKSVPWEETKYSGRDRSEV